MHASVCRARNRRIVLTMFSLLGLLAADFAFANAAPKISGTPPTTVKVNSWYVFTPTATDSDTAHRRLRYSVANKPSWAVFIIYSGQLAGMPPTAGTWKNIRITVTDGKSSATLPAFSITATSSGTTANRAPTIGGTPATSIASNSTYSFTPHASDPEGKKLAFSIQNKPSWASFSTTSGKLSGTPSSSQTGTYSHIIISASDGANKVSLPAFSIAVSGVGTGSAALSWMPPTRNTDGSTLTNLAGYKIYYGTSSGALNKTIQISNAGISSYVVENLSPATYYFAVKAYTTAGVESALSNTASKAVR
jgi:hypothetical protein